MRHETKAVLLQVAVISWDVGRFKSLPSWSTQTHGLLCRKCPQKLSNPMPTFLQDHSLRPGPCCFSSARAYSSKMSLFYVSRVMDDLHTAALWHQFCLLCRCCCRRTTLNKKAKSNQGQNAVLPRGDCATSTLQIMERSQMRTNEWRRVAEPSS